MNLIWAMVLVTAEGAVWDSGLRFDDFQKCDAHREKALEIIVSVQPNGGLEADNDRHAMYNMRCLPVGE